MALQTFYFDMKDGVPIRDRIGKRFALNAEAVDHSKRLAARFRNESGHDEPDLTICVLDELVGRFLGSNRMLAGTEVVKCPCEMRAWSLSTKVLL
jgi:hypothetical protein